MRMFFGFVLLTLFATGNVCAQAVDSGFAWGRDYTFERMTATRAVNDAEDKGAIRLVAYVYRPVKNDRHKVVLFSHGSTGGLARSPKEAMDAPPVPVVSFFVSRGYTLSPRCVAAETNQAEHMSRSVPFSPTSAPSKSRFLVASVQ
jgi:hypothetical protein